MYPGGQEHSTTWLYTLHSVLSVHGFDMQGSSQRLLIHALFVGQSILLLHPNKTQDTVGLPFKPGGHSQMALWFIARHSAPFPQDIAVDEQAGMQLCLTHMCVPLQSSFVWQPVTKT